MPNEICYAVFMTVKNYTQLTQLVRSREWSLWSEEQKKEAWISFPWYLRDSYLLDLLSPEQPAFWYTSSDVLMNYSVTKNLLTGISHSPSLTPEKYHMHRDAFFACSVIDDHSFDEQVSLQKYGLASYFGKETLSVADWTQETPLTPENVEIFGFLASHYQQERHLILHKMVDAQIVYGDTILLHGLQKTIQYFQYTVPSDKVQECMEALTPYHPTLMLPLLEESRQWGFLAYTKELEHFFQQYNESVHYSEMNIHF